MTYKQIKATTNRLFVYRVKRKKFFEKIKCS